MRLLLNCGEQEKSFRAPIQRWAKAHNAAVQITYGERTLEELQAKAELYKIDAVVVPCTETMYQLIGKNKGTQQDWAGSLLWLDPPVLIVNPLNHVRSVPHGDWLLEQHLNKLPEVIAKGKPEEHKYSVVASNAEAKECLHDITRAAYIVADIETSRLNSITSIAFTEVSNDLEIGHTWVFNLHVKALAPLWTWCRRIMDLPSRKVFHNGTFDSFHLCRWYMPPRNYILDTEYMWHCWYAELKMSLAFVANTVLYDARFWKYEAAANPLKYNALDTINTARIFVHLMKEMPDWAWRNYSKLVPNIAPVVWCEFEGFKTDLPKLEGIRNEAQARQAKLKQQLKDMAGYQNFNPSSAVQISRWLYTVLRARKVQSRGRAKPKSKTGTDIVTLAKVATQHPLYARIISTLLEYRALSTAISTFYTARLSPGGRLLYSLNVAGTSTERMSCTSSSLYAPMLEGQTLSSQQNYGAQLQNVPPYMKVALCADDGFLLINIDKDKAEAHCVAKLSKDKAFWNDLKGDLDFYLALGNRLFGLDVRDKKDPIRQVFKKINHQTSYMAGGEALLDAIGPKEVFKYMAILGWKCSPLSFATHCIKSLLKSYPKRKEWWDSTRTFIKNFGYIETPDGHRRKVFTYGNATVSHSVLRAIVAHQPQHFSVAGLNEAFWKAFYFIQLESNGEFRLKGQEHDSIVAQAKEEKIKEYEKALIKCMDIVQPTDFGDLRIPLDSDVSYYWKEGKV